MTEQPTNPSPDVTFDGTVGIGTPASADPRQRLTVFNDTEMVIQTLKTGGDSTDPNVDGAINVKHAKNYAATPGYAHTYQVYAEAGMEGLILGCNDFAGVTDSPYAPAPSSVPTGFLRFELGPLWPYSEKMRLTGRGELVIGWTLIRKHVASQSGTTVTLTQGAFADADATRFFCWGDYETGGGQAHADRIVRVLSPTTCEVSTPRQVPSQAARVCSPNLLVTAEGALEWRDVNGNTTAYITRNGRLGFTTGAGGYREVEAGGRDTGGGGYRALRVPN